MKKINVSAAFALAAALLICCENAGLILALFAAVGLHEAGHALLIALCGGTVEKFTLGFGGMDIRYTCRRGTYEKDALIALAGPGANLLSCLLLIVPTRLLQWEGLYLFCGCSMLLCLFNLLPALPLDGGVFLRAMLLRRREVAQVEAVLVCTTLAVGCLLLAAGIWLCIASHGNSTLLICAAVILGRLLQNSFTPGRKSLIV